ncbi:MAG TPA: sensor histidine kinase [Anaerolineae bacterium]|nr:sensor histidine kinase [Anaerolineae bacterium]HOQ97601.1 sensor histidine kinase [Anaerolineae bacterium]HPL27390.1 sensor histidine kinase [Anaerolineae bacterium]
MGQAQRPRPLLSFFGTVEGTLVLLLLAVLLPVILAQVGLSLVNFEVRAAEQAQSQLNVARVAAVTANNYVRDVERTELAIGTALTASPPPPPQEETRLLAASTAAYIAVLRFSWFDPAGRAIASSEPRVVGLDFGDRLYVQQVQAGQEMVVSDLFPARIGDGQIFVIARGIRDAQGNLQGMVVAAIDPDVVSRVLLPTELTNGTTVAVFDANGQLVYQNPPAAPGVTRQDWARALPQLAQAQAGQEAMGAFVSPANGQRQVFGLTPAGTTGWVALAYRPQAQVTAPLVQNLLVQLGLLLGIGALGLAIALRGSRSITVPLEHVRRHALAVGRGEQPPPLQPRGPIELRDLAVASNHMAAEIQAREERIRALYGAERQARAEAEAAVRAREQFLAGSAHELKTPVTNLRGFAELALRRLTKRGVLSPEELRRTLETIDRQADRLARLVAQLLDVASIEAGEMELRRQETDLTALAQGVASRLHAATQRRVDVAAPGPLPALVDAARIEQVLANLVDNAAKFSPKDRPVEVALAAPDPESVRIAVRDHGPGIPPERRELIFTRFYQAQAGRPFSGLGLGLYYARRIVELHGGTIAAEAPPGGGTRLVLTLPVRPPEGQGLEQAR